MVCCGPLLNVNFVRWMSPQNWYPPGIFSANDVVVMLEVFVVDAGTSENAVLHAGPW